jgi:hypothetical protein
LLIKSKESTAIGGAPQWRFPLAASWRKLTIGFYDERSSGLRRMPAMKSIIMLAALALGAAATQQAVACDWNQLHANSSPATVVVCDNGSCRAVEPSTTQQAATTEPKAPTVATEPADPAPVTVALH